MLEKILSYLNNYFEVSDEPPKPEKYTISDGTLSLDGVSDGQYIRIFGSVFNDGVYQYPLSGLTDEVFTGYVIPLAVPKAVVSLADEIGEWTKSNQPTAYTSESFGGYSYSKATNADGVAAGWQDVFRARLAPYRKMAQH